MSVGRDLGAKGNLKVRLHLRDGTFVDLWAKSSGGRYSFHWEHRAKGGQMHRYDNAPDHPDLASFPMHIHDGEEGRVRESHHGGDLSTSLREFLKFVRIELAEFDA